MRRLIGRPIFMVVGVVVIGIVVGLVLTQVVFKPSVETAARAQALATATPTPEPPLGPTYQVKSRIVNLADPGGRRYLRVTMVIEFRAKKPLAKLSAADQDKEIKAESDQIATYAPVIEDTITTILTSKTYADVATPDGKEQLKATIKDAIDSALPGQTVTQVYFTDFVIQ